MKKQYINDRCRGAIKRLSVLLFMIGLFPAREIVIQNLPDLSGVWHIYGASEKDIPSPSRRRDFKFKRVDKSTDPNEEEELAGIGLYTVIVITDSGKEVPLHEVRFNGQALLIRTRIVKAPDGRKVELPGLMMKGVGDPFEGYWTIS